MGEKWASITADEFDKAYPEYLVNQHSRFLSGVEPDVGTSMAWYTEAVGVATPDTNIITLINEGVATNPYSSAAAYNPDDVIDEIRDQVDALISELGSFDWENLSSDIGAATSELLEDNYPLTDTQIAAMVAQYLADSELDYLRRRSQYATQYYEINALGASSCVIGLAFMDSERSREGAEMTAKLQAQVAMQRGQAFSDALRLVAAEANLKPDFIRSVIGTIMETGRMEIIAKNDQYARDLDIDARDILWPVDLTMKGMASLSAIAGAPLAEAKPSKMEQALSSIMGTGVNAAMSVGQAFGPAAGVATFGVSAAASLAKMFFL